MMKTLRLAFERLQNRLDFSGKNPDERKSRNAEAAKRPPKRKRRR